MVELSVEQFIYTAVTFKTARPHHMPVQYTMTTVEGHATDISLMWNTQYSLTVMHQGLMEEHLEELPMHTNVNSLIAQAKKVVE